MQRFFVIILAVLIAWLQYRAWYGENSMRDIDTLSEKIEEQIKHNDLLAEQNAKLRDEITLLRNEPQVLEEKAREHLGLVKKGEIFYRIIPAEEK